MNSLNSVLLEGNLVKNPDSKVINTGSTVCNFTIACNRFYKQDGVIVEKVSYFDITSWNGLAEKCSLYLAKGRGVRVVGRLEQHRWIDDDGLAKHKVSIIADNIDIKPTPSHNTTNYAEKEKNIETVTS